ncbi:MAG: hypothetical protein D6767_01060 [Candidatus Hydrogenedentota bacterium]|nr:MAG: hypothetical protein D6767_01060 [Candidatus Hydrogenedentota bacterium]
MLETGGQAFSQLQDLDESILQSNVPIQELFNTNYSLNRFLHISIYHYAQNRFQADRDLASDFYVYMLEKLNDLLSNYDRQKNIPFSVYLAYHLRISFLKFLREKNHRDWLERITGELQNPEVFSSETHFRRESIPMFFKRIFPLIGDLETINQTAIRLYLGFPLLLSQFRFLLHRHRTFKIFLEYRKYLQQVETWKKKQNEYFQSLEEKHSRHLHELTELRQKTILSELEKKRARYLEKRLFYIRKRLKKIRPPVRYKTISYFIQEPIIKVYRRIQKGLQYIQERLKEKVQYVH